MKVIVAFIVGALLGAGSLFMYLRQIGHVDPQPVVVVAPATTGVATPGAPGTAATGAVITPGSLPPAPVVPTDLSEADLPLRPVQTASDAATAPTSAAATAPKLLIPVEGMKLAQLSDNFDQPRGAERHHEALDIMAPKGTKVLAVADGKVAKLFDSKAGGLTIYQFDPSDKLAYYYAHLDKYADGLKEGAEIKRGDVIGYVGVTGNSSPTAPHLHFAVFELTPEKQWWKGTPLNPFPMMAD
jgi:murein DD-endopeptidase MepM/ murein hydrolase activator NlpD